MPQSMHGIFTYIGLVSGVDLIFHTWIVDGEHCGTQNGFARSAQRLQPEVQPKCSKHGLIKSL